MLHTDDPVVMARIARVGNAAVQTEDNRDHHECFGPSNQSILDRIAFGKSRLLRVARRPLTKVVTMMMMMTPFWMMLRARKKWIVIVRIDRLAVALGYDSLVCKRFLLRRRSPA